MLIDNKSPMRRRTGRSLENIAVVNESIAENSRTAIVFNIFKFHEALGNLNQQMLASANINKKSLDL